MLENKNKLRIRLRLILQFEKINPADSIVKYSVSEDTDVCVFVCESEIFEKLRDRKDVRL